MLYQTARKLVIGVIGGTIVLLGLIMLVTPGPGIPAILVGLAILATEFVWAQRLLSKVKEHAKTAKEKVMGKKGGGDADAKQAGRRKFHVFLVTFGFIFGALLLYVGAYVSLRRLGIMEHMTKGSWSSSSRDVVTGHYVGVPLLTPTTSAHRFAGVMFQPATWAEVKYWNHKYPNGTPLQDIPKSDQWSGY